MARQDQVVRDEPLPEPGEFLRIEVFYAKGGMSYFSGESSPRGYYVSVRPITKKADGMTSWMMFSGGKHLLAPATRFSAKTLGLHVAGLDEAVVEKLKVTVLADEAGKREVGGKRRP